MAAKHVHMYRKVEINGVKVFACGLPECSHHMPKHYENLLLGKFSICWKCRETMKLDHDNMQFDFPWCNNCMKSSISGLSGENEVITNKVIINEHEPIKSEIKTLDIKALDKLFGN
jgi:hypothetical protein